MTEFHPVEHVSPARNRMAMAGLILLCDHARNAVPTEIGDLGLPPGDMGRHIAWDVGARGVTLGLAARLGAGAVLSTFTRLVIDPNRGEDDPTLVMRLYDGSIIPANRHIGAAEIERRRTVYYRPYHAAIREAIEAIVAAGETPVLVSIHSFTPRFRGRPPRPWHVGLLWDRDDRLVRPLLARLRTEDGLVVGDLPFFFFQPLDALDDRLQLAGRDRGGGDCIVHACSPDSSARQGADHTGAAGARQPVSQSLCCSSVILMADLVGSLLFGGRLGLVFVAPVLVGHAVDDLAALGLADLDPLLGGGLLIPAAEAVPAEAGQVHHVDVLHIAAVAQVVAQAAEHGRLDLGHVKLGHLVLLSLSIEG